MSWLPDIGEELVMLNGKPARVIDTFQPYGPAPYFCEGFLALTDDGDLWCYLLNDIDGEEVPRFIGCLGEYREPTHPRHPVDIEVRRDER